MPGQMSREERGHSRAVAGATLLGLLVVVAYLPALSAGYVWDDDALLTANKNVQSLEGLVETWKNPRANNDFYPLTHTSFWVEYHLWGYAPLGYHLDNILLHAANAVLVWLILKRLSVPGAWVAAAIFALHPVQVESVAWVAERKSVLGGLFCLLAVLLFVRVTLTGDDLSVRRRRLLYGLSLACFALALLARPVMMAAAAVLPLVVWYKRGRLARGDVFRIAWYWVLAAAMAPVTIWVQYAHVKASGQAFDFSMPERVLIAGRALWFYLDKLVWPPPLIFCYDKWAIDAGAWWQWLYPAGAAAALAGLVLLRKRIGLGPLIGAGAFIIMLSPALGFFNVYWHQYYFVADHMQYLACIGLIAVATATAVRLRARIRPALWFAAVIVLGALGVQTWQQCSHYKDAETLWTDTIDKNPGSWMALNNRGNIYSHREDWERAIHDYDEAVRFNPDSANAYNNRGLTLASMGDLDAAIRDFDQVIRIEPENPRNYVTRGAVYASKGEFDRAIQDYDAAIGLKSDYADAYTNRGLAYAKKKEFDRAIRDYDEAVRINPDYATAYSNRGQAYSNKGDHARAIQDYDQALRLDPHQAETYLYRGNAFTLSSDYDRAIQDYSQAIQVRPNYADAFGNRARVYFVKREYDRALADLKKYLDLGGTPDPEFIQALETATRQNEP
jgi:protein O-mannosyl-transferase